MIVPKPVKAIWDFAVRVLTGIVLFILISLGAGVLNFVTGYENAHRLLPGFMLTSMQALAYVIFAVDGIVFLVFFIREALKAIGILSPD